MLIFTFGASDTQAIFNIPYLQFLSAINYVRSTLRLYLPYLKLISFLAMMEDTWTLMSSEADSPSAAVNTVPKHSLLTLPGEIRSTIWRIFLTTSQAFMERTRESDQEAHYELQPAIQRVNCQIYHETHGILKEGNMWIFLCVTMPKQLINYGDHEMARVPVFRRGLLRDPSAVQNCYLGLRSPALSISLQMQYDAREHDNHIMIMARSFYRTSYSYCPQY